jgi:NDP-sugar pyrophosphorylase family protein
MSKKPKYEILKDNFIYYSGSKLYRIRALKDFDYVKKGDLGGFVEREDNLSQYESCWIYDNAKVFDNARVYDKAMIGDNTCIFGNALIYGYARIKDDCRIFGYAKIFGNVNLFNETSVQDSVQIYQSAKISGHSFISGNAKIYGNANIQDSKIEDDAKIYGYAVIKNVTVLGDAKVSQHMLLKYSTCSTDLTLKSNILDNIRCQTGLPVFSDEKGDYVLGFKHVVNYNLCQKIVFYSKYDPDFKYTLNEWSKAENPDISNESCSSGLHFSNLWYWEGKGCNTVIQVKCYVKDIITIQSGKIRCKKLLPLAVVKNGI